MMKHEPLNKYNVAGLLRTYSEQCAKSETERQLKDQLSKLIEELKMILEGF